tara:strand:+ start:144 stop:1424 length:1281 start_codon:yes stop_codon:yes gene_type:complete
MKKKLIRIFLFGILLFIISKALIAFNAFQVISSIKEKHEDEFLLTYKWISSSLDGSISIEGIELTPYSMKKTFSIGELTLHYADYYSLVTQLAYLKDGQLDGLKSISVPSIQSEFKGKSFRTLLADKWGTSTLSPFEIYGCGTRNNLSAEDYLLMGVNHWDASLSVQFSQTTLGHKLHTMTLDQKELGRIKFSTETDKHVIETLIKQQKIDELSFFSLNIEHQDAGLFRRLNILCNKNESDKRSFFSAKAALDWKNAMFSKGFLVNDSLVELYARYLMQGGTLILDAKKESGFQLINYKQLINKNVINYFDVALNLNEQALNDAELYVDGSIIYPPEKEPIPEFLPVANELKFEPGYKEIELEFIDLHIGRKIRVNMQSGKNYEGVLGSVTEYNVELTQNLAGGEVNYPLMLNEIKKFEVWFNQEY